MRARAVFSNKGVCLAAAASEILVNGARGVARSLGETERGGGGGPALAMMAGRRSLWEA